MLLLFIIWLDIHQDISTVLSYCGHETAHLVQTHQMVGC